MDERFLRFFMADGKKQVCHAARDDMEKDSGIREAGRGFVLITGAKLWFLVTATFTSLAFPRLFGDPILFGQYRVVSGLLNVITMVVITASVQAVSRLASVPGADLRQVGRTAAVGQTLVFGPVFVLFFALHDVIATKFLADPGISVPLLVSTFVVLAYTYYAALIGVLNGTRNFGRQAGMDILFSTIKTALMIAAVVVTGSVAITYGAFVATAWVVLAVACFVVRGVLRRSTPKNGGGLLLRSYLEYLLPLAGYALVLNLLLQADVVAVKAFLARLPGMSGTGSSADAASVAAGVYGAAKNVALLPYQAVISLAFIVFPLVSTASSSGDREGASRVVAGAFRLASILSWCAVAVFAAAPSSILGLLFGASYRTGASGLVILLAAGAMLAFMHVGNAALASSGRPLVSVVGGIGAAVVQIGLLFLLLPGAAAASVPELAAVATLAGSAFGAVVSGILNARMHGFRGWLWSSVSSIMAAAAAVGTAGLLEGRVFWVIQPCAALLVFVVVLMATRGVGRADRDMIVSMIRRRAGRRGSGQAA